MSQSTQWLVRQIRNLPLEQFWFMSSCKKNSLRDLQQGVQKCDVLSCRFNPIRGQLKTVLDFWLVTVCMKECELIKEGHTFGLLALRQGKYWDYLLVHLEEHEWRSGERTRLPPTWDGFESWRRRHMWVEFVVGSLPFTERFFSWHSGFPLSLKTNTSKFQFDLEHTDTFHLLSAA